MICHSKIKTGSDYSGVGAFDQALMRLKIEQDKIFACDIDEYARKTYILNYGEPKYFPYDVNEREIPNESLDIYMTSPPCQSFSLAGKRGGESDHRGILFYNSHEFIKVNKPRYFIFENVRGLLSDDKKNASDEIGRTFRIWLDYLGGKSVNGNPIIFPHEESVPYHIYHKVLNAKDFNVPQNRDRIFIVGIRDDCDNDFSWGKPMQLKKRLKDILEDNPNNKYNLTNKMYECLENHKWDGKKGVPLVNKSETARTLRTEIGKMGRQDNYIPVDDKFYLNDNKIKWIESHREKRESRNKYPLTEDDIAGTVNARYYKMGAEDNYVEFVADFRNDEGLRIRKDGLSPCVTARRHSETDISTMPALIGSANKKIRRLTPRECFRLMDFPETFKWDVSDTQAYRQAGNSIVVACLVRIISRLKL